MCTDDTFGSTTAPGVPKPDASMFAAGGPGGLHPPSDINGERPNSSQFLAQGRHEASLSGGPSVHGQYDQSALQQLCNISTSLHNNPLLNSSLNSLPFPQQNNLYAHLMQQYGAGVNPLLSGGVADGMSGFSGIPPHGAPLGAGTINDYAGNVGYSHPLSAPSALQQNLLAGSSLGLSHDHLANAAYKNDIAMLNRDAAMLNSLSGWNSSFPPAPSGLEPSGLSYLSNVATSGEDASNSQLLLQLQQLQQQQQKQKQQTNSLLLEKLQSNTKQE